MALDVTEDMLAPLPQWLAARGNIIDHQAANETSDMLSATAALILPTRESAGL